MCDLLCVLGSRSADGVARFAKNSDRPPDEPQAIEWHPPRQERTTRTTYLEIEGHPTPTHGVLASRPTWMWGVEHGVSTARVAVGNATIFTTLDPRPFPAALTGMDLVRLALERADSAAHALDVITGLLARHGQGGSGHRDAERPYWSSFVVADPTEAFVLETSGREWAVEAVEGTRATSNRTTIPAFDEARRHPRQPVASLVDPRLAASRALLASRRPLDDRDLMAHLRSHVGGDGGWTVCMHVADVEATTASLVVALTGPERGPLVARVLLGSPCRSVFVPVVVGEPLGTVPTWERFAALDDRARPALDRLEAALAERVRRASPEHWNALAWAEVDRTLTRLGV